MFYNFQIVSFCCIFLIFSNIILQDEIFAATSNSSSLKLLYVLFRHGNRTHDPPQVLYPTDPYNYETYPLIGLGELTNAGKQRAYNVGIALRETYDSFLTPYYDVEAIEPRSTWLNRTKASLLLVLASLYPPKGPQIWNPSLLWQPIPYNYLELREDKYFFGIDCPYYQVERDNYVKSPEVQAVYEKYQPIFDYISNNTGANERSFNNVSSVYFRLQTEEQWGFTLPEWTQKVYPEIMAEMTIEKYYILTGTLTLRKMAIGYFLQRMVNDMERLINGTNTKKRIYLNSAIDDNIAFALIVLGIFEPPRIPSFGAYLVFELHEIDNEYGIKIFYQNYEEADPQLMTLPNCTELCNFDTFVSTIQEYFPEDPDLCYRT